MTPGAGLPYLIAEVGLNHNGDISLAKQMVNAAKESGAHAAKFQLYNSDAFLHPDAKLADGTLRDFFRQFELSAQHWRELADYTRSAGLDFFCSVFDAPSLAIYAKLEPSAIKIASCDITNRPLMEHAARALPGKRFLAATGTASEEEVREFVRWFKSKIGAELLLMECVSSYPANPAEYNLALLKSWREELGVETGLSDHTGGHGVAVAASVLGARAIEKHFTLDHSLPGPDHGISMNPAQFRQMRDEIERAVLALGGGRKTWHASEEGPRKFGRRSAYAAKALSKGERLNKEDILYMRPGGGLGPETELAGKSLKADVRPFEMITEELIADDVV